MEVIESRKQMQERAESLRLTGHTVALVPTMGFLHEGHLELIRVGKRHSDKLIISIFVNPTQFGPSEDLGKYPRDTEGDLEKARKVGVDFVFLPSTQEMYPEGYQTRVQVERVTQHLCGISRPGHFEGVTTVVAKLLNITKPHMAIFGQKDFQQLTVISRMVMDLNMDIQIIGVPTVREPDGLAMSSRNKFLSPEERESALSLRKSLDLAGEMFMEGEPSGIRQDCAKCGAKLAALQLFKCPVCEKYYLPKWRVNPRLWGQPGSNVCEHCGLDVDQWHMDEAKKRKKK